ncbi:chloride channel protein [Erwinia sp. OLTSP20]|uniref:H(+)/Cl(-) exchange transporter ClcA n=1 Tax=unclassified Erwinia TaxID=2622719 RepID=UPI000C1894D6|nr:MULTISPECIES: H(+)/Cl(-) exchange transporter ClcA [unclassified Erwinia]PIJ49806.1 chloride channel protein [Erwinia sp. OAMSP11]PIJ70969.1 chloride channel protein [Erwinia sp. OLSSP12]PIJ80271.1 chloride channel protein [Erwinia sp. OLCASP19]PIJ82395.1 chloride channel protein [Erwinia sp. OLMTSP26]PIJ85145.1 chloride channel protein [Erwinia sp. OLMDSP33]
MNPEKQAEESQQAALRGRSDFLRKVLRRDRTPVNVLLLAALVGVLAGLLGVAFEKAVSMIIAWRLGILSPGASWLALRYPLAVMLSALLALIGYWLVRRFAPEASGSGIPEIEGALEELRPVRWWRVIPVKFIGGLGTLGAGMVLGREGPTVQMGGNLGRMVVDIFRIQHAETRHTLLATGAAAGLSAAFNAPLAGILFIIEEMRLQFRYSLISIKAVFLGVVMSCIVYRLFNGAGAVIAVGRLGDVSIKSLWLYLLLGLLFGALGVGFNALVCRIQDRFLSFHSRGMRYTLLSGALLGGLCGLLGMIEPEAAGGGFNLIPLAVAGHYTLGTLLFIFISRVVTTLLCFCSGAPGGIFAPMLALGTLAGTAFGMACSALLPSWSLDAGTFAIAGMGALFAASVRAPLTGILLVLEMSDNYQLILPMIITCFGATLVAQFCGGQPLYSTLLARTLARQQPQTTTAQAAYSAPRSNLPAQDG